MLGHAPTDSAQYEHFRARRHFGSLDGLRCLSILAVIWHHTRPAALNDVAILQHGHLGVDLFFVVSGFLITTLLLRERDASGDISLKRFYIRRTLRIFPLYFTVLLAYVGLVLMFDRHSPAGRAFFANLPYFATYTSNWFLTYNNERIIFYFVWSLAAEEQFYLFWPTVEKRLGPRRAVIFVIALLLVVSVAAAGAFDRLLPPPTLAYRIVTRFPVAIGLGVLLAHVLHDPRSFRWAGLLLGRRVSAPVILVVLGVALLPVAPSEWLIHVAMAALVGAVVIREDNLLAPVLGWRPIAHIGVVSYGMYLLHMLCCNFARRVLEHFGVSQPLAPFFATTVVAVAAASVSFRYYESFFLRLKDRYGARLEPTAGKSGAEGRPRPPDPSPVPLEPIG
jgi:peptidoglycan/LPS O-acetylase OafA/YrhL